MNQLSLDFESDRPNPNAAFFDADGKPKRLLWCSDDARIRGVCPYRDERLIGGELRPPIPERFRPEGGCCHDLRRAAVSGSVSVS